MPKYVVQYTIDYIHRVQVGITAPHRRAALKIAQQQFDDGTILLDTPDVPLLFDDFEEQDGQSLEFTIEATYPDDAPWPRPDESVLAERRRAAAFRTVHTLLNVVSEKNGQLIINTDALRDVLCEARAATAIDDSP